MEYIEKAIPLGPCQFFLNDDELGYTVKGENTLLKIVPIIQEIKTDESSEVKDIIELGRNINVETTILISKKALVNLGIDSKITSLIRRGQIRIVSTEDNSIIKLFNAILVLEFNFNFKSDKFHSVKVKISALKDNKNRDIEIIN